MLLMSCGVAQVGDPGEHPLFTGVALKRATGDESDEDAAAGELMLAAQHRAHLHHPATFELSGLHKTRRRLNGSVDSWTACWSGGRLTPGRSSGTKPRTGWLAGT